MPKAKDLRLRGVRFEDVVKRLIAAPKMPKAAPKKPAKSTPRKK